MQTGEELEAKTIIFPLGGAKGTSTREAPRGDEIVEGGRLEVVACEHLILAFYRSFARS